MSTTDMEDTQDKVVRADCVKWLRKWREQAGDETAGLADLIFADPPFNIGYKYDVYEDRKAYQEYYDWTKQWMSACRDVLKPTGSFWIAIGDEYAAEVRMIGRELDLHLRNWVIWHYTFGQNTKKKFARAHTHLFYFVADPREFTFNDEAVRTLSDRQRVYRDKRASKNGKIPDDVWAEFPRVCGTFAEREGWHPCQMPETLLARIIRACSRVGEMVLDPFAGSGTTLVAAKKLNRHYLGMEMSKQYAAKASDRLGQTRRLCDLAPKEEKHWAIEHIQE
ncbi:MAG: DNA-methyltransferase, partial [Planctomycetota bacterium]